jgi:site-specific recombinase XerD
VKIERQLPEFINKFLQYQIVAKNLSKNTVTAYEADLYAFCKWYEEYREVEEVSIDSFAKLSLEDTTEWRMTLSNEPSTISRKISSLKALLRYLNNDTKEITNDLAERIVHPKLPEKIAFTLTEEIAKKFVDKVREIGTLKEIAIATILFNTAMRAEEVCNLNLGDIRKDEIFIRGAKGQKDRINIANQKIIDAVNDWLKVRPKTSSNALFVIDQFKSKEPYRITYNTVWNLVIKYGDILKIDEMHPHTCRHTWATIALNKGVPIRTIQKQLGHKHESTTYRYAKFTTEQLRYATNMVNI